MSDPGPIGRPRYEQKYVLDGSLAQRFIGSLLDILEDDPHAVRGGYRVNSVYYDTPAFDAYFEKLEGQDPRHKIRARFYGGEPRSEEMDGAYAFVEIKHREDVLIRKTRVRVPARAIRALPSGDRLAAAIRETCAMPDLEDADAVARRLLARPTWPACIVRYHRRVWMARINPTLRITLDTDVRVSGPTSQGLAHASRGVRFLPPQLAVLELKYHHAMPLWLLTACREFGLIQRRDSKYCSGLERLHPGLARREVRLRTTIRR